MYIKFLSYLIGFFLLVPFQVFSDEEDRGGIEEITVTAEKRTSTVSDTSMSITAFDSSLLEDLGMQGADDLMDQLPATTRDAYDVRFRGVGSNFRALGGDPGSIWAPRRPKAEKNVKKGSSPTPPKAQLGAKI